MRIAVDMTRCQSYAQCCFLAPDAFRFVGNEALVYDPHPSDADRNKVLQAAAACPVQAIQIDRADLPVRSGPVRSTAPRGGTLLPPTARVVVVGASLAGLRSVEAMRRAGFAGVITVVGAEHQAPYDRPPLSKQVLTGLTEAASTSLPSLEDTSAEWRLGVPATALDLDEKRVLLADGGSLPFDRLLIATGTRARPWAPAEEAALDGVVTIRTADDAADLRQRLAKRPHRVLVIGGGFTGSEVASSCCELDLTVTMVDRGPTPLASALGATIGRFAADTMAEHGVDLRSRTTVTRLIGDQHGRLRGAVLSDGSTINTDIAVVALGSIPNVEWLDWSGVDASPGGVRCDASGRVIDVQGQPLDDVFAAGDVACFPSSWFGLRDSPTEHWGEAVLQARVAGGNLVTGQHGTRERDAIPAFWSVQFGHLIKAVGMPTIADEVVITQGSLDSRSFVAVYGRDGRTVAAVSVDQPKWLEHHRRSVADNAPFPPTGPNVGGPSHPHPERAEIRRSAAHPTRSTR